jgi:hypothetical protein
MSRRLKVAAWRLVCSSMLLLTVSISPLNAQQIDMPADAARADALWAQVLKHFVGGLGRIDFKSLAADCRNLDRYAA